MFPAGCGRAALRACRDRGSQHARAVWRPHLRAGSLRPRSLGADSRSTSLQRSKVLTARRFKTHYFLTRLGRLMWRRRGRPEAESSSCGCRWATFPRSSSPCPGERPLQPRRETLAAQGLRGSQRSRSLPLRQETQRSRWAGGLNKEEAHTARGQRRRPSLIPAAHSTR